MHEEEGTRNGDAKQTVDLSALKHIAGEAGQWTDEKLREWTRRARGDNDA